VSRPSRPNLKRAIAAADRILAQHGVLAPPVPVEHILAANGLHIHYKPLEPNVSGVLVRKDGTAYVGVNAIHHKNRQRFTLAHELAHYLLHPDQPTVTVDDALIHFRGEDMTLPADTQEMEANAFAGALLMPAKLLRADLAGRYIDALDERAVRDLAGRYQVSQQALTIRLVRLGFLGGVGDLGGRR
jgi:hypothetical protein